MSFDADAEVILVNALTFTSDTVYHLILESTIDSNGSTNSRDVYIEILYTPSYDCSDQYCAECDPNDNSNCYVCEDGYAFYSSYEYCEPTQASVETKAFVYLTYSGISSDGIMIMATSMINLQSPQGFWLIVNQFQLYYLFYLTGAYIPKYVSDYLVGLKIALFSFSFMNVRNIESVDKFLNWLDFSQPNKNLDDIGISSGSTLVNISSIIMIVLIVGLAHILFLLLRFCLKN